MSLTQVPIELKNRNVSVTCAAWTPWIMTNGDKIYQFEGKRPHIGIDSCGIFMVDKHSNIGVALQWGPDSIDPITGAVVSPQSAVADDAGTAFRRELHRYKFGNAPGQHWACFCRGKAQTSLQGDGAKFARSLHDLLDPATTQDVLALIQKPVGMTGCGYLKVKQKVLDPKEWLVDGEVHNGAHFPLCIFIVAEGHRSDKAWLIRKEKAAARKTEKNKAWRETHRSRPPTFSSHRPSSVFPPPPPFSVLSSVVPPRPVQQPIGSEACGSQDVPQSRRQFFLPQSLALLSTQR